MADIPLTSRSFETDLTLEESAFGCERTVSYEAPIDCVNCEGAGRDDGETCAFCDGAGTIIELRRSTITFPGPLDDGEVLQLKAKGIPGTLAVTVRELPHAVFERDGEDLHTSLDVPAKILAGGGVVNVETLDDDRELAIPPGSGEGSVVRLRGHGFPSKEHPERRGDLLVKLSAVPETTPIERGARRSGAGLAGIGLAFLLVGLATMILVLVIRSNATVCETTETRVCMVVRNGEAIGVEYESAEEQREEQNIAAALGVGIGLATMGFGGWLASRGLAEAGRDRIEQRRN
ncbi:J domain-containing protein [Glycomyces sp. YM15]|uniref:J domain-containing protein n=1 Tax=Glycomyces sp. YM15 TaxID=2800446 RepID=UPI001966CBBD|nr:J domain-containing protein [Glycomyces sp. YM15]